MIAKLINPILLFGRIHKKMSTGFKHQAAEGISSVMPVSASENPVSEIKRIINGSVVTFEGTYQGRPIRVRIFNEPGTDLT